MPEDADRDLRRTRSGLVACSILCAVGLVYASILPVTPAAATWQQAMEAFGGLPWLDLDVYRRADWVANALAVIPVGFFFAAALDWGQSSRWRLVLWTPVIWFCLLALVAAIEFLQIWFPPRTRSLNDLLAGSIGAIAGPCLWLLFGRACGRAIREVQVAQLTETRLLWGVILVATAFSVQAVMPLDLVLSGEEWQAKWREGRIVLLPGIETVFTPSTWKGMLLSGFRSAVLTLLVALGSDRRSALVAGIGFSVLCELLQLPIFTRTASTLDLIGGVAGTGLVLLVLPCRNRLEHWLRSSTVWWIAFGVTLAGTLFLSLARSEDLVRAPEALAIRWRSFFDFPFAKYYFTSEFEAASNVLLKLSIFAVVGLLLAGAKARSPDGPQTRLVFACSAFSVFSVAFAIEISQVYFTPHVADLTDVLTYLAGAGMGYLAYDLLTRNEPSLGHE